MPPRTLPAALVLALALLALAVPPSAQAIQLAPGFTDERVTTTPDGPTTLAFTPDGRLLIALQTGKILAWKDGVLSPTPVLDLTAKACTDSERGVNGLAVDPSFLTNRFVYVYYTFKLHSTCGGEPSDGPVNRASRFVMGADGTLDPSSETVLIDNIPAFQGVHNGGNLAFGPDGYLYVSVGDGGCYFRDRSLCASRNPVSRDLSALQGKILRVTRDGEVPITNPFDGEGSTRCALTGSTAPGGRCAEVYASGLRNPFRFSFDPNPGEQRFFINDVGSNDWEEIDVGAPAADYGWNLREGPCSAADTSDCGPAPAGVTDPLYTYDHSAGCSSVTGSAFVPAGAWPVEYDGRYVFADYVCGRIWTMDPAGGAPVPLATETGAVITMLFGPSGTGQALYYTVLGAESEVRRLRYTGTANRRPAADARATPTSGEASPLTVAFDGTGSSDPDGDTLTYDWDFGDGSAHSDEPSPSHEYATEGRYQATLTVTDPGGSSDTDTVQIDVGNTPPTPVIDTPVTSKRFRVGETIVLRGHASDVQEGDLGDTSLTWVVRRKHASHFHPFLAETGGNNVSFVAPAPEDLAAAGNSLLEIALTARDSSGLEATVVQELQPHIVDVSLTTAPTGLDVVADELTVTAPATIKAWEGQTLTMSAPTQTLDGVSHEWEAWSDGGASTHGYTVPAGASTLRASFAPDPTLVRVNGDELDIVGGANRASLITVDRTATGFEVRDAAGSVAAGAGCSALDAVVSCPLEAIARIEADGRGGDDRIEVTGPTPADLRGGLGDDTLIGGDGDDTFDADTGADTMTGRGGTDTVRYASRSQPVTVRLDGFANDGYPNENDNASVENAVGGTENDLLFGDPGANRLEGGPGSDYMEPRLGPDVLVGGPGDDDRVSYLDRSAPVTIRLDGLANEGEEGEGDHAATDVESGLGGNGDDIVVGSTGRNVLEGRGGTDLVDGRAGADLLRGGDGTDTVTYRDRTQRVVVQLASGNGDQGQTGENDALSGFENVEGGDGSDLLAGTTGANRLTGGQGDDVLQGGEGNDVLDGGTGNDDEIGEGGDDVFLQGAVANGADAISGRAGRDRVDYGQRTAPLAVSLDATGNDGGADERDNVFTSTEDVRGGSGDDVITGSGIPNALDGGAGADRITGGLGDDDEIGGDGNDTFLQGSSPDGGDSISGRGDIDVVDYGQRTAPVRVTLDAATGDGEPGVESDNVFTSTENVRGGSGDDRLIGSGAPNALDGGAGADRLEGGEGNDRLTGGSGPDDEIGDGGDDTFLQGALPDGADAISGRAGSDTLDYGERVLPVTVTIDAVTGDGAPGENDNVFTSTEHVTGGSGDDRLEGSNGPNRLLGGLGADSLFGLGGADELLAGDGFLDPQVVCGPGVDVAVADPFDGVTRDGADLCESVT